MSSDLEHYIGLAKKRVEKVYLQILKDYGYSQETEKVKILLELIKEQVKDENSSYPAGKVR